jgi:hypothetical protein
MIYEYTLKDPKGSVIVSSTISTVVDEQRQIIKKIYKDLDRHGLMRRFWFKKKEENLFKSLTGFTLILRKINDGHNQNVSELAQDLS